MEDNQSSWDDLLKQIGAAPPPDAFERKRPAIETPIEPPRPAPPAAAEPPRPGGDWNSLAKNLGIEVEPEPEPLRPAARDQAAYAAPTHAELEAGFAGIEPMESEFEEIIEEEISDVDFSEEGDDDDDSDDRAGDELTDDDLEGEFDEPPGLSGEAARSAFEALFQAGSFAAMENIEKAKPREPARRPPSPSSRGDERRPSSREHDRGEPDNRERLRSSESRETTPSARGERRRGEDESQQSSGDDAGDRPRRSRRRGRGRGRGGERSDSRGGQAQQAERGRADEDWDDADLESTGGDIREADDEAEGERGEREGRRRRRPRRRRSEASERQGSAGSSPRNGVAPPAAQKRDIDDEDSNDHESDDGGDDEDGGARASHKNIPSWVEAINVMVETNMQGRASSPGRSSQSRGRGRGGRGRRPRKS